LLPTGEAHDAYDLVDIVHDTLDHNRSVVITYFVIADYSANSCGKYQNEIAYGCSLGFTLPRLCPVSSKK
jgi:hypothetical protein